MPAFGGATKALDRRRAVHPSLPYPAQLTLAGR
jgi:hypothetical protein